MSKFSINDGPLEPPAHDDVKRQFFFAVAGFLLPLAIFFGWFFFLRALSFAFVLAALLLLIVIALVGGARFKNSRALKIGSTWLFVGCLGALFWAMLISGMPD